METFVVRVWSEEGARELQGVVRHVGTGREISFSGPLQLIDLLSGGFVSDRPVGPLTPPEPTPG